MCKLIDKTYAHNGNAWGRYLYLRAFCGYKVSDKRLAQARMRGYRANGHV